jgi:hypothetical protein
MKPLPAPDLPIGVSDDGSLKIIGVSPDVLPADNSFDGSVITVYGSGFEDGATVKIGDMDCTNVQILDKHTLTCDPPQGSVSVNDLTVTRADGITSVAHDAVEFADPSVYWVRPIYAYTDSPLLRSFTSSTTSSTTVPPVDAAEEPARASGTEQAVAAFTG